MRYLVVIPARGGSKGIPKKNIYPLCGKPLIDYSIEVMNGVVFEHDLVVSSDSDEILHIVDKYENVYQIKRPYEISGDYASTEDALIHALNYMESQFKKKYDAVITLQTTSPLRTTNTINSFVEQFERISECDAQLTLSKNTTDFWVENDEGTYSRLYPNASRRRQERKPLYAENSCIYATKVEALFSTHSILGKRCTGFIIESVEALDINEPIDLIVAEAILNNLKTIEGD